MDTTSNGCSCSSSSRMWRQKVWLGRLPNCCGRSKHSALSLWWWAACIRIRLPQRNHSYRFNPFQHTSTLAALKPINQTATTQPLQRRQHCPLHRIKPVLKIPLFPKPLHNWARLWYWFRLWIIGYSIRIVDLGRGRENLGKLGASKNQLSSLFTLYVQVKNKYHALHNICFWQIETNEIF